MAWWKLDETEGNSVHDSSGNDYSGTLIGGPQWQPDGGKIDGALAFDGVDDYVDCGSQEGLNLSHAVSVSVWIKLTGSAKDQKIISNQDNLSGGYKIGIYGNKPELEIRDSANMPAQNRYVEGGTELEPDVWYHIAVTYSQGGSIKVYVNGKLDREIATPNTLAPSAGALMIGREPFQDLYWFNGLMDDLQIYNYPLSQTEVTKLYAGQALPVVAQIETPTTSAEEPEKASHWIPVSVIAALAIVICALVARRKKAAV